MSDATEAACEHHATHMMDKANVVGVAGGDDRVLVFVTKKEPLSALAADDVVDREVDGIRTDVIEVGIIEPMIDPGDSIGLSGGGTGTYGGPVVDENDVEYLLTNNHVAANSNMALVLSPILHPGPADGNGSQIGVLARFEPIYFDRPNFIDAALVRADSGLKLGHLPHASTTTGRTGWVVQKTGRTSGHTQGKVVGRNATIDVNFGAQGVARFVNQLITTEMLWPGDSGSVLLSTSGHPIALGFAGSSVISIHTPINLVLRTLAVRFAT